MSPRHAPEIPRDRLSQRWPRNVLEDMALAAEAKDQTTTDWLIDAAQEKMKRQNKEKKS